MAFRVLTYIALIVVAICAVTMLGVGGAILLNLLLMAVGM